MPNKKFIVFAFMFFAGFGAIAQVYAPVNPMASNGVKKNVEVSV